MLVFPWARRKASNFPLGYEDFSQVNVLLVDCSMDKERDHANPSITKKPRAIFLTYWLASLGRPDDQWTNLRSVVKVVKPLSFEGSLPSLIFEFFWAKVL